ncbi:MAG: VWA domain-containing protein [Candidatus Firestonebacteria bacterium]
MHFDNSYYLFLLFLVPGLILFFIATFKVKQNILKNFGELALLSKLIDPIIKKRQITKTILLIISITLLILVLAGPQFGSKLVEIKRHGVDILIAVDCSTSMLAEDIKPNRMEKVVSELSGVIEKLQGDRIGIIAFAGVPFVQCPLTLDYSAAKMILQLINTNLIPYPGTAIGEAIRTAIKSFSQKERKYKVLILLTDGEDHNTNPLGAADDARKEGIQIYTIGFGNPQGEPIPIRDETGTVTGYKKDKKGEVIMSKLDETTLQKIALQTGGKYYRASDGEIEVDRIYEDISKMEKKQLTSKTYSKYEDRFQWILFPALLLLIFEFIFPERKMKVKLGDLIKKIRRLKPAATILCLILFFSSQSYASLAGKTKQGNKYYKHKQYDKALEKYRDAQISSPESPVLHFNIGNSNYKKEMYEQALPEFEKATYSKDIKIQAKTYYNAGNCLYKQNKLPESIQYYKKALELDPNDEDAKYNIEFVQKKIKENMDKNKQNEKSQQQQQSQGKKQEQNKKEKEKKDEKNQQGEKKTGMSKEQAESILNAMKDDEKRNQKNKKMMQMPAIPNVEYDW